MRGAPEPARWKSPGGRGERLPRMKTTMFRRRWIVVITSVVLIGFTILLQYGPAVAYRY